MADQPHVVDVHVGSRVRLCRTLKGMSQQKLAKTLGLTFQQVQKYEKGFNRVSASRLWELSRILDVPTSFFFEGADDLAEVGDAAVAVAADEDAMDPKRLFRREILELVRAYDRIEDPAVRKRLYDLVKSLGPTED